jgi:hypothetical protein
MTVAVTTPTSPATTTGSAGAYRLPVASTRASATSGVVPPNSATETLKLIASAP